jgi:hypothetical protein
MTLQLDALDQLLVLHVHAAHVALSGRIIKRNLDLRVACSGGQSCCVDPG